MKDDSIEFKGIEKTYGGKPKGAFETYNGHGSL